KGYTPRSQVYYSLPEVRDARTVTFRLFFLLSSCVGESLSIPVKLK
ncbi:unnamed protein product, partial [Allacma fusca]